MAQFIPILLVAAIIFGICYLVDKAFSKLFRSKAQHRSGKAVRANKRYGVFGVVLTMYDGRTNFSAQVAEEVRRHFPGKVFTSVIPRNIRLAEAPSHGIPVSAYDRSSRGAVAYKALAEEIHKKL